jgi:plasmid stabilization system protein ParE
MTPTAEVHFWEALGDTTRKWGEKQAEKYRLKFLDGLQHIAENHEKFHSSHRDDLAAGTDFSVHLVEHRYVAFQAQNQNTVIIAAIFHESMDIPTRLRELQTMGRHEIDILRREIGHLRTTIKN